MEKTENLILLLAGILFALIIIGTVINRPVEKVWVVEYSDNRFADCNGLYHKKEDAETAITKDFERCSDIWHDVELTHDEKDFKQWSFVIWCEDDQQYEEIWVNLYNQEIW